MKEKLLGYLLGPFGTLALIAGFAALPFIQSKERITLENLEATRRQLHPYQGWLRQYLWHGGMWLGKSRKL